METIVETGYAYPSSATAKEYRAAKTGCYYYTVTDPRRAKPRPEVFGGGYATAAEAEAAARDFAAGFMSNGGMISTESHVGAAPFLRITITPA